MKGYTMLIILLLAVTGPAMAQEQRLFNLKEIQEFRADEAMVKTIIDRPAVRVRPHFLEPGQNRPRHGHDSDEIVILLEGKLAWVVDGKRFSLRAGDLMLIPEGAFAEVRNDGDTRATFIAVLTKKVAR